LKGTGFSPYISSNRNRAGLQPPRHGSLKASDQKPGPLNSLDSRPEGRPSVRPGPTRLGILLSGRGSNFLAIAQSIRRGRLPGVEIAVVISNVPDAGGLKAAVELDLPHAALVSKGRSRADHDADVIACLQSHQVDLVCLAGYMRLLSPQFIAAFPNKILNIHPSLLPAFPGLEAQRQAFDYGVKVAGCTVHFVDEHLDHGVIILQNPIPVLDTDDAQSLSTRILAEEHIAYTEAIARVTSGAYEIRDRRFVPKMAPGGSQR